ncbi:MAG: carboxypeptidase-like regulatory domain-containing protein, partial [Bacteroidota bacterium]|nr:carboxypeptidase-like regulatory domain-containing protein [Bacteroidota bacterium]
MKQKLLLFLLTLSTFTGTSQITGLVSNTDGEPLPYVNIYQKNAATGTTSNGDGNYELDIAKPGNYTIVFQF